MSNSWFRVYSEFANDPKVQSMPEHMQRRLIMLFCLRSCDVLVTLCDDDIAFQLRISAEDLQQTKALFMKKGFVGDDWEVLNWEARQFISDSSSHRTKAYRERQKQKKLNAGNVLEASQERHGDALDTDTDTDTDTDSNAETKKKPKKQKPVPPSASLFVLPEGFPVDEWEAFVEMRKAAKKAMTDHAKELMVKKLLGFADAGYDVKAILNASIMGGWSGVYEPKVKPVVAGSVGSKLGVHGQATAENAKRFIESMQANGGNQ